MNSLKFECYLLLSVLILSLFGCDKEETVQGYYIKNLKGLDLEKIQVYEFSLDSALLFGFRDQKIWIGVFDNHTKKQLHEWESLNVYKEKEYKIDYGRTITWNIEGIDCLLKTDLGYVCYSRGISYGEDPYGGGYPTLGPDLFFFKHDENIIYVNQPEKFITANVCGLLAWYNGSIVSGSSNVNESIVYSMEGEKITNLKYSPNRINDIPVSYTEGIRINRGYVVDRYDYQTGKSIWETSLEKVQADALMTVDTIKRTEEIWEFTCDITNKDGSKEQIKFTLNIKNGMLTYI